MSPLFLLHTQPDPQRLAAWAARRQLLDRQGDLGYALHALLHAAFGEQAPQPFRYQGVEQGLLAYTHLSPADLAQHTALADPEVAAALGLGPTLHHNGFSARPFPTQWATGHMLGFEARVRPIIREGATGRERDAFLAAIDKAPGQPLDRAAVYVDWLRALLARQGGATLVQAHVTRYQQLDVTRKTHKSGPDAPRQSQRVGGPDAVLAGQLCVADPVAFAQLIAKGLGRHRAFGFGLLLLRSASA